MVHAKKLRISENVDHRWGMIFFCKLEIKRPFGTNEVLIIAGSNIFVQCICHSYLTKPHWPQTSSPFEDVMCLDASCIISWIQMGHGFFGDDREEKGKGICYFPFCYQSCNWITTKRCPYLFEWNASLHRTMNLTFFWAFRIHRCRSLETYYQWHKK